MAMQTGVSASKVLVLCGAGLTGSIILRSGHLSDLIGQLQELIKNLNEAEISPGKYDAFMLATQVRLLAKEIKELSISSPVTFFNGNSSSSGGYASYVLPTAALGAMGCCYMWWKGWSFSDLMFVTKHNMANAVASVSKQLENVSEALASTKKHLTKKLENLDWKLDEQRAESKVIAHDVNEVKTDLNQIGYCIALIQDLVSGLEGKIELLESKQDITNSGLWYLCQVAGDIKDGQSSKIIQDVGMKLIDHSTAVHDAEKNKGLQFIVGIDESNASPKISTYRKDDPDIPSQKASTTKYVIHRSYTTGLFFSQNILG